MSSDVIRDVQDQDGHHHHQDEDDRAAGAAGSRNPERHVEAIPESQQVQDRRGNRILMKSQNDKSLNE